jgi:hypothetical protein
MFSAEEINLMCIFDVSSRKNLLNELRDSLSDVYDPEMREVYESTIEKIEKISDAEISEVGLCIADEFDEFIDDEGEYDIAE